MRAHQKLKQSIAALISDFQRNPFDFLYEADLQAALFAKACSNFEPERITMRGGYHSPEYYPNHGEISTIPVKCEYPGSQRFDIAVIDSSNIQVYDAEKWKTHGWKNDNFWELPVCAAVELKYLQLGDRPNDRVSGLKKDLEKLERYSGNPDGFLGVAMLFIQSDAQYSATSCSEMSMLTNIDEVGCGSYGVIVAPSHVSWHSSQAIYNKPASAEARLNRSR